MTPSVDMSPLAEGATTSAHNFVSPVIAAVTVDFDKTVFIQMVLFALLIVVLKPLLLDPMLRVFALREERTDGAKGEARKMQERAAEILANYEKEVAKVRAQATAERDAIRKGTAKLEAEILAEGHSAAEAIATQGRQRIQTEIGALESDLVQKATAISREIGSKVLGREISS
jgi:F-type H+-transporting ATPase subunit b